MASGRDEIGVLLVEDDDGDALIVEDLLAEGSLNARLVRGRTVREALVELNGEIDCVLLDLGLPDGLGVDTVGRVRAAAPRIAVIVLTGLDNEAAGEAAVDAGAQDYLSRARSTATGWPGPFATPSGAGTPRMSSSSCTSRRSRLRRTHAWSGAWSRIRLWMIRRSGSPRATCAEAAGPSSAVISTTPCRRPTAPST